MSISLFSLALSLSSSQVTDSHYAPRWTLLLGMTICQPVHPLNWPLVMLDNFIIHEINPAPTGSPSAGTCDNWDELAHVLCPRPDCLGRSTLAYANVIRSIRTMATLARLQRLMRSKNICRRQKSTGKTHGDPLHYTGLSSAWNFAYPIVRVAIQCDTKYLTKPFTIHHTRPLAPAAAPSPA